MFKTPCHAPLCNIQTPTTCCITGGWYGYIQNPPLRTAPRSGLHQAGDTQCYLQAHPAPDSLQKSLPATIPYRQNTVASATLFAASNPLL